MNFTRRLFILMLAVILSVSVLIVPASAAGSVLYGIGFVNTEGLRLRSAASTTSSVVGTAHRNDCVVLIAKSGDWYKVNYNLQEGYMHKNYLNVLTRENAELGYGKVTGNSVNIRRGNGTQYDRITTRPAGTKMEYVATAENGWYAVVIGIQVGWVSGNYSKVI